MTDAPLYLTTLPRGFSFKQGPILLEVARGPLVMVRIPRTNTVGSGPNDAAALSDLAKQVAWWFLREGPRLSEPTFQHTKTTRRMMGEWRIIDALVAYEPVTM